MPPSQGLRESVKRRARHVKKWFGSEAQVSNTSRTPSSLPQTQTPPSLTAPLLRRIPTQEQLPQPPAQSQRSGGFLQPALAIGESRSNASLVTADDIQPSNAGSTLAQAAKGIGEDAWNGLKGALQLLETSSDAFPPLKSAVAGFLDVVDAAAKSQGDYAALASNLKGMIQEFAGRPGQQASSRMLAALDDMVNGLQKEMKHVEKQGQRSRFRRYLEVRRGSDDVQECYERVEALRRALQDKAMIRMWSIGEEQQVDARLKDLNAALRAMYDSSLSDVVGRRMCTPGTREAILAEMRTWADDPKSTKIYWLNGMAGTGKTTLAYSFCAEMQRVRRLGASFFCSRADTESRDVSRIVPTIAYQLARLSPAYREALIRQMDGDKDIGARRIETQFEKLIRGPLRKAKASGLMDIVVTIDALDECDRRDGAHDILNALLVNASDLPIKFVVTCRPEPGLFEVLQSQEEHRRSVLHLHDIESSFVLADIKTYLEAELGALSLSREKVEQLVEQAGTLFIYAATAVRYIRPKVGKVKSNQRLEQLLSVTSKAGTNKHRDIDDLYTAVLAAPFGDDGLETREKEIIRLVLDTAICAREPMSVSTMARLLELEDDDDVLNALQHLRSVLHISQGADLISTLHASFPDFMLDCNRSKDLGCDAPKHHQHLSLCCFVTMRSSLRFNICELESSFVIDEKVPDLARRIEKTISPELFYACRYWGDHVKLAEALGDIHFALEDFLSHRLLFWMEVMNLKSCIGTGARVLAETHGWLQQSGATNEVLEVTLDAGRFVTAFGMSPASRSTPHIYVSALPFWQKTRPVGERYWKQTRGLVRLEGSAMERRDLLCLGTWNATSATYCVAFSPDSARVVSCSDDHTIRVWDAHSGALVAGPFEGHTKPVRSVSFSPDGTRIVSGSDDRTVCVWDARSGILAAGPFEGHTGWVRSVGFSPNGTRIVSCSGDRTIRVWDARSGILVAGPFEGHTHWISSVSFSPDGTHIVSGSSDLTIRVWDAGSGALVAGPFKGHSDVVLSVGFSPDGTRIVSGSQDRTIRVWDARSGDAVAGPLEGHTNIVGSVGFSHDGTRIVSGSHDSTICVWDAHSGVLAAGPFKGHTSSVHSVSFSPDGTRIVSGSADSTIRVWDARTGVLVARLLAGHANIVRSVGFSPDAARIVTGSVDRTVCVWDARSGDLVAGPFKGHTDSVQSVGFSPDGTRIVSGSGDRTICVWDARSGALVAGPFEGHTNLVRSVGFSLDGTHIVSGSLDNTIRVWDARSGVLVAGPFEGHTDWINSASFSPDGTRIVSGSSDMTIRVWDAGSGDLVVGPFKGHTWSVLSTGFSPDGTRIVSGSGDRTIRVWDARSGVLAAGPFEGHTDSVNSVSFSPDGTRIVSGSTDLTVRVWDHSSGVLVAGPFEGHTDWISAVGFSPDGSRIVSGSLDDTIRIWEVTPHHIHHPGILTDWRMDENGVVTTQQGQILLSVPRDLWTGLLWPHNTVCIYRKGALALDFSGVLMGADWAQCYQSH